MKEGRTQLPAQRESPTQDRQEQKDSYRSNSLLGSLEKNRMGSKMQNQLLKLKRTSPLNISGEDPNRLPASQCAVVDLRNSCVRSKLLQSLRQIRQKSRYERKKRPKEFRFQSVTVHYAQNDNSILVQPTQHLTDPTGGEADTAPHTSQNPARPTVPTRVQNSPPFQHSLSSDMSHHFMNSSFLSTLANLADQRQLAAGEDSPQYKVFHSVDQERTQTSQQSNSPCVLYVVQNPPKTGCSSGAASSASAIQTPKYLSMRPGAVLEEPSALAFFQNKLRQLASKGPGQESQEESPHSPQNAQISETGLGAQDSDRVVLYFDENEEQSDQPQRHLNIKAPKTSRRPSVDIRNDLGAAHNWIRLINALRPLEAATPLERLQARREQNNLLRERDDNQIIPPAPTRTQSRDEETGIFSQDNLEYLIRVLELEEELDRDSADLSLSYDQNEEIKTPGSGTSRSSHSWSQASSSQNPTPHSNSLATPLNNNSMNSTRTLDLTSPLTKSHLMQKLCAVQEIHAKDEEDPGNGVVEGVPTEEGEAYARFVVGYPSLLSISDSSQDNSMISEQNSFQMQSVSENISPPQILIEEVKQRESENQIPQFRTEQPGNFQPELLVIRLNDVVRRMKQKEEHDKQQRLNPQQSVDLEEVIERLQNLRESVPE